MSKAYEADGNMQAALFEWPSPAEEERTARQKNPIEQENPEVGVKKEQGNGPVGRQFPSFDYVVATDGACSGNPGPGGWAWVEQKTGYRESGGARSTTNNQMELEAMIRALEWVDPSASLLIRADSSYVINSLTKWGPGWRKKGWRKADGKPVLNRELQEKLLALYEARTGRTKIEWVKGHSGDAANELVDSLAVQQSRLHSQ